MLSITSRYVAREFFYAFMVGFSFCFFVFVANVLLVTAEDIFSNEVPIGKVTRLILFSVPLIISYSVPFGSMLGALMTVSRLSADNEVIAFMAIGVPLWRLFLPLKAVGVALAVVLFISNELLLPAGNIEFNKAYRQILYANPSVEFESYAVRDYGGIVIVTGAIEGNTIEKPLIFDRTSSGDDRLIIADEASIVGNVDQNDVVSLRLRDVFAHITNNKNEQHETLRAHSMDYNILLRDVSLSLQSTGPAEMSSTDLLLEIRNMREKLVTDGAQNAAIQAAERVRLLAQIEIAEETVISDPGLLADERRRLAIITNRFERTKGQSSSARNLHTYLLELHKKYAVPLACFTFVSLAIPVGRLAKRSGRPFGFLVGIGICFLYWALLIFVEASSWRAGIPAPMSIWLPNILVLVAAGLMATVHRSR